MSRTYRGILGDLTREYYRESRRKFGRKHSISFALADSSLFALASRESHPVDHTLLSNRIKVHCNTFVSNDVHFRTFVQLEVGIKVIELIDKLFSKPKFWYIRVTSGGFTKQRAEPRASCKHPLPGPHHSRVSYVTKFMWLKCTSVFFYKLKISI